jgi:hypothetical protein
MGGVRLLSFRGRRLGRAFVLRAIELAQDGACTLSEAERRDGLIVVEAGAIELVCPAAGRRQFGPGALLCLRGLDRCVLRNYGPRPARLSVVTRRVRRSAPIPIRLLPGQS